VPLTICGGPVGLGNFAFAVAHAAKVNVNGVEKRKEQEISPNLSNLKTAVETTKYTKHTK